MNNSKFKIVFAILMLIVFLLVGVINYQKKRELEKNGRYTIGVTRTSKATARNGLRVIYNYSINGIEYHGYTPYEESDMLIIPNGRYYVQFSSVNPDNSEMLINTPIPANIFEAPIEGWDKLPDCSIFVK